MGTVPFTLRLEEELKSSLEAEAKREDRSAAYLATRAIKAMLDTKAAKRRLIEDAMAEADKGAFVSEEAMNAWFQSLGTDDELPDPDADVVVKPA
jgi:predicted transcriptional regulator